MIKHTPDSPDWERLKSNRIDKIEQEIAYHAERITFYETKIAEWALTALRCADGRVLPLDYDGNKIPARTEKRAK